MTTSRSFLSSLEIKLKLSWFFYNDNNAISLLFFNSSDAYYNDLEIFETAKETTSLSFYNSLEANFKRESS